VTDASLATMRLATSRGEATVPAWLFTVAELVVPVPHAAVAPSAITAPPQPRIAADSDLSGGAAVVYGTCGQWMIMGC
jgi:hypothetical protein